MAESSLEPLNKDLEVPLQLQWIVLENAVLWVGVWYSAAAEHFLRASPPLFMDHNCHQRENVEHPCLMADEKGPISSSVLHWPAESPVHSAAATVADNSVVHSPPFFLLVSTQQSNRGFNPFPQVETIFSLIFLFLLSLSDGQAAWAVMEGSPAGQRWLSWIIPLWNPPPPLK